MKVYQELKRRDFNVQSIIAESRGVKDNDVIEIAKTHGKIIVTMDKDFGYLTVSYNPPGLALHRLRNPRR